MSQAGQNYSMLIGWDREHCFLITGSLLVIDSGNFGKTLQIREKEILNCTRALRLHIESKSWHQERLIQKAKAKWKVSAVLTYCKSQRCCQIELCARKWNFRFMPRAVLPWYGPLTFWNTCLILHFIEIFKFWSLLGYLLINLWIGVSYTWITNLRVSAF